MINGELCYDIHGGGQTACPIDAVNGCYSRELIVIFCAVGNGDVCVGSSGDGVVILEIYAVGTPMDQVFRRPWHRVPAELHLAAVVGDSELWHGRSEIAEIYISIE